MTFRKLQKEYNKRGISLVAARQRGKYYLSIQIVPYVTEGIEHAPGTCQLTGYYTVYGKSFLLDVDNMTKEVFNQYKQKYANNPKMLSYVS